MSPTARRWMHRALRWTLAATFLLAAACFGLAFCATAQKKPKVDNEKDPQYQYEKAIIAMKYGLPDLVIPPAPKQAEPYQPDLVKDARELLEELEEPDEGVE
jgi:ABC-type transporter lipoprotein component MlaA